MSSLTLFRWKGLVALMVTIQATLLLSIPQSACAASSDQQRPGLALRDLSNQRHSLTEFRDQVVVVNFWATWCGPCVQELPILADVAREYSGRKVQFIAVSIDDPDTFDAVAPVARKAGVAFPVWVGASTDDMDRFGLGSAVPATAVLANDGTIAARMQGGVSKNQLRKQLDAILKKQPAPQPAVISADAGCQASCCAGKQGQEEKKDAQPTAEPQQPVANLEVPEAPDQAAAPSLTDEIVAHHEHEGDHTEIAEQDAPPAEEPRAASIDISSVPSCPS